MHVFSSNIDKNDFISYNYIIMKYKLNRIIQLIIINLITLTRFFGAISLPFIYHYWGPSVCALVTIILFFTDAVDGFLARALHASTFFGSVLDGACDKLLNAMSFILLALTYNVMIFPLILEVCILIVMYSTYRNGGNVQSSKTGKIKTLILDVCVVLLFAVISLPTYSLNNEFVTYLINNTDSIVYIFGCVITIASLIALGGYIKTNKETIKDPKMIHIKKQKRVLKPYKSIVRMFFDSEYYYKHKDESIMKQLYK